MKRGLYRVKLIPSELTSTYTFFENGIAKLTCNIEARSMCANSRLIKYLDKDGRYRFYPFLENWKQVNQTTSLGNISNFVSSIKESQSNVKNIGFKNIKSIYLTAEKVSDDELLILESMYYSPCVYLYVGNGTDELSDWVLVTIKGDGISRSGQKGFKKINIEVILPDSNTIKR